MTFWIVIGIIVLIGLWAISVYNGLVGGRNQAQTAWSQIDVQLKRRHDLIPNLVQVVKDAMGYEHLWIDVHGDDYQWRAPQLRCHGNEYHP